MNYNKVIYIIIGAAALLALPLIYLVLSPLGQTTLSPSQWLVFGGLALPVVLAALIPMIVHRVRQARGLPPEHVSAADLRFMIIVIAILCPLAAFAAMTFGAFGALVMMLAPVATIIRSQRGSQPNPK